MIRADTITARWWSPALNRPGEIVTDEADINQALGIIFTTPKGADPHRPSFGCDLERLLDRPVNEIIARLPAALIEACQLWEPRVIPISAPVEIASTGAQLIYSLIWQWRYGQGGGRFDGTLVRGAGSAAQEQTL